MVSNVTIIAIVATLVLIVIMMFVPEKTMDRIALIVAVVSLSATAYTLWVRLPNHLDDIKSLVA